MAYYASTLIEHALKEQGYHEKASNSQLDDKTANSGSNNWNKYARDMDTKYSGVYNSNKNIGKIAAWCQIFVHWNFFECFGREAAMKLLNLTPKGAGAGCAYAYGYMKKINRVGKEPKVGAIAYFGEIEEKIHHVGIVVAFNDSAIYTIEGNTSNQVARRTYKRPAKTIFGYAYPDYTPENIPNMKYATDNYNSSSTQSASNTSVTSYTPSNKEISLGSMDALKKEVQAIGRVYNCDSLNVRILPGAENPQLKSIPSIPNGTIVEVLDKVNAANGKAWYYIRIGGKVHGFVSASYIQLVNASAISSSSAFAPIQDDSGKYSTK